MMNPIAILFCLGILSLHSLPADDSQDKLLAAAERKTNSVLQHFPSSLQMDGVTYKFDQNYLERSMRGTLQLLDERVKLGTSSPEVIQRIKITIAYQIIAAGLFANETPELVELLKSAASQLQNEKLPEGIASPYSQMLGIVLLTFSDPQGAVPGTDVLDMRDTDFKSLITQTKIFLSQRKALSEFR